MPVNLFHQNVRNLTPNSYERIAAFKREYAVVNHDMGSYYVVAGFTELLNDPRSIQTMVLKLARQLDAGLTEVVVINAGMVVGKTEYVGIAYDPDVFTLEYAGSTGPKYSMYSSGGWGCYNVSTPNDEKASTKGQPPAKKKSFVVGAPTGFKYKPDHRCVGYVAGKVDRKEHIFGFTHNDYGGGGRSAGFRNLETAAGLIIAETNYTHSPLVVFGGDFNKDPDDLNTLKAVYQRLKRKRSRSDSDSDSRDSDSDSGSSGVRVPTCGKNTYDFWMVSEHPDGFQGFVHQNTQGQDRSFQTLSDHCGISLKFYV